MGKLKFRGYWGDGDQDVPDLGPWETFTVCLFGNEAGDFVDPEDTARALIASGYDLILVKRNTDPQTSHPDKTA